MPNTFELIASSTVGSGGSANITFSSIPSTFTDLCVLYSARTNRNDLADDVNLQFNGVTTGYSNKRLYGYGTGVTSDSPANIQGGFATATTTTANTFGNGLIYIPNYTSSNQKSFSVDAVSENNNSTAVMCLLAGLSNITAAISSILLAPTNGTAFVQYSTAYLYGVKNA